MIYLRLFLNFLMIGALSFGGGYGMVSLVRETVLSNGWLTENEFLNFIAVSESTPGPLAVNMATFIGSTQGGILGSFVATLGVVLPSFLIILLIASALKNLMKYAPVNAFFIGSSSVRCSDDPCDRAQHGAVYAVWPHRFTGRICARFALYRSICHARSNASDL